MINYLPILSNSSRHNWRLFLVLSFLSPLLRNYRCRYAAFLKIQKIHLQIQIQIQTNGNTGGGCCCFIPPLRLKVSLLFHLLFFFFLLLTFYFSLGVSLLFHLLAGEMPAGSQEFGSPADQRTWPHSHSPFF